MRVWLLGILFCSMNAQGGYQELTCIYTKNKGKIAGAFILKKNSKSERERTGQDLLPYWYIINGHAPDAAGEGLFQAFVHNFMLKKSMKRVKRSKL